jgi:hypothetical protein
MRCPCIVSDIAQLPKTQAKSHSPAVAQAVGLGLGRSKMLNLSRGIDCLHLRHILLKYKVNSCFSMLRPGITSGRAKVWKVSVVRSEIRSRAELNCALPLFLQPSHQRDTAHRPIGTGRLHARRRFGYWGEQIGHLRDQSGHHFGARRQTSNLQPRVGYRNIKSTDRRRLIAKEQHHMRHPDSWVICRSFWSSTLKADIAAWTARPRSYLRRCQNAGNQR